MRGGRILRRVSVVGLILVMSGCAANALHCAGPLQRINAVSAGERALSGARTGPLVVKP